MIATTSSRAGLSVNRLGLGCSRQSALPGAITSQQQRRVVMRFKEDDSTPNVQTSLKEVQPEIEQLPFAAPRRGSGTRLSPEQQQEVGTRRHVQQQLFAALASLPCPLVPGCSSIPACLLAFSGCPVHWLARPDLRMPAAAAVHLPHHQAIHPGAIHT